MNTETNKFQRQTLFQITWPIFFELALHMGMGIIATLMLSHYSDDAATGVGVANQLLNIFILIFNVTSIGATILIGQRLGANQLDQARQLARSAFGLNFWFGMAVATIVVIFGKQFLGLFELEGDVLAYGLLFVQICGASLFLESIALALSAVLRSHGYTKDSLMVTLLMDMISVGGNVIAITGIFGLPITGVTGVAWAMVVARAFAVGALLYLVFRQLALRIRFKDIFIVRKKDIQGLLSIGIPSAGENLSYQLSQVIITGFIAMMGTASLAARVYVLNISMICYLFTLAIAQGTQLLVARYIGGKQYDKALRRGMRTLKISMCASFATTLIIALLGSPILHMFTTDPAIIAVALPVLWIMVITETGRAMNIVLMGSLKSAGDVRFPVIIGIFAMWGIAVVFSYTLGIYFGLGLLGVWIAQGMDEWFRGCFAMRRWVNKPWDTTQNVNRPTK